MYDHQTIIVSAVVRLRRLQLRLLRAYGVTPTVSFPCARFDAKTFGTGSGARPGAPSRRTRRRRRRTCFHVDVVFAVCGSAAPPTSSSAGFLLWQFAAPPPANAGKLLRLCDRTCLPLLFITSTGNGINGFFPVPYDVVIVIIKTLSSRESFDRDRRPRRTTRTRALRRGGCTRARVPVCCSVGRTARAPPTTPRRGRRPCWIVWCTRCDC